MVHYIEIPHQYERTGHPVTQVHIEKCAHSAALHHHIDEYLLLAILDVEHGNEGMVKKNNGQTWDLGVAQINTVQLKEDFFKREYKNITWRKLANNTCLNIDVAARILELRISELHKGASVFNAAGHYHSKTPTHKMAYLQIVMHKYFQRATKSGTGFNLR